MPNTHFTQPWFTIDGWIVNKLLFIKIRDDMIHNHRQVHRLYTLGLIFLASSHPPIYYFIGFRFYLFEELIKHKYLER